MDDDDRRWLANYLDPEASERKQIARRIVREKMPRPRRPGKMANGLSFRVDTAHFSRPSHLRRYDL